MASVRGCNLPDDLLCEAENTNWYRDQGDGTVMLGMNAVAAPYGVENGGRRLRWLYGLRSWRKAWNRGR
jgi:hypothetical protein